MTKSESFDVTPSSGAACRITGSDFMLNSDKKILSLLSPLGVFLFLFDRFLKFQALHRWPGARLLHPYLGWDPFHNPGVAFSLPLPNWLILVLTAPIILLLGYLLASQFRQPPIANFLSLVLVFAGALSNFIDRLWYGFTVDYLQIATGVINLSDLLILAGFVLYFCCKSKTLSSKS